MNIGAGSDANQGFAATQIPFQFPGPDPTAGPDQAVPYWMFDTKDSINFVSAARAANKFQTLLRGLADDATLNLTFINSKGTIEGLKANLIEAFENIKVGLSKGTKVTSIPADLTQSLIGLCEQIILKAKAANDKTSIASLEKLVPAIMIVVDFYSTENPKKVAFTCGNNYNGPDSGKCPGRRRQLSVTGDSEPQPHGRRLSNEEAVFHILRRYVEPHTLPILKSIFAS
jgi:hypothetical protein